MSSTTQARSDEGPGFFVRFSDAVSRITGSSFATIVAGAAILV
jgi:hypothetical protein